MRYTDNILQAISARETVEVARLTKDVNLEISMIAIKD